MVKASHKHNVALRQMSQSRFFRRRRRLELQGFTNLRLTLRQLGIKEKKPLGECLSVLASEKI